jgi:hypothetical protein
MIWKARNITKTEAIWHKLDKETKHDLLELSVKEREEIAIKRSKRLDKRVKARGITLTEDGFAG